MNKFIAAVLVVALVFFACYACYKKGVGDRLPDGAWIGVPVNINLKNGVFGGILRINGTNNMITPNLATLVETGKWYRVTLEVNQAHSYFRYSPIEITP